MLQSFRTSELAYYFDRRDCGVLSRRAVSATQDLVAVHWRHPVEGYPLTGDMVHEVLHRAATDEGMIRMTSLVEADLRLDVWSRDRRSVARRTGVPGS